MKQRRFLNFIHFLSFLCFITFMDSLALAKNIEKPIIVNIEAMQFNPQKLTVSVNQTVKWINNDLVPHTVTAADNSFDSKTIESGKTWVHRFRKAGSYPYRCQFHPAMLATVEVK
jgi:plastocyanin